MSIKLKNNVLKSHRLSASKTQEEGNNIRKLVLLYEREKQSRCYFQLERDKLTKIREIESFKQNELKAQLKELQVEISKLKHSHQEEITHLSNKVRYLNNEHERQMNNLKFEGQINQDEVLKSRLDEQNAYLDGFKRNIATMNEENANSEELVKNLQIDFENRLSLITQDYSDAVKSVQETIQSKFVKEKEDFSLITKNAVHEICELKNTQLEQMKTIKNNSFCELKLYFKNLTKDLVSSIKSLEQKCSLLSKHLKEEKNLNSLNNEQIFKLNTENQELQLRIKQLKATSSIYESEKKAFQTKQIELKKLMTKFNNLDLQYEALLQINERFSLERDGLQKFIQNLIMVFREKFEFKNHLSNKKIELLNKEIESYEKTLNY